MNKIELYFQSRLTEAKKSFPKIFEEAFFQDRVNLTIILVSALVLLAVWITSFVMLHISDFMVPVRYNSFSGVTELGSSLSVYRIPIIYNFCVIINLYLSRIIYKKDKLIGYILNGTNVVIGVITLILIINFARIVGA